MPRIKGPRKINRYPDEFKVRAVRMSALPGVQVQDVAHALDIHPFMLSRWRKLVREGLLVADDDGILDPETTAELQRLRQIERECPAQGGACPPKKGHPVLLRTKAEIFAFIEQSRQTRDIALMCRLYGVSRAGFYAWRQHRARQDQVLTRRIVALYSDSRERYGSPRIHRALRREGIRVGRKRVARLMRQQALKGRSARIYLKKAKPRKYFSGIPNHSRGLALNRPNQVWVGDITHLKVAGHWRYLAVVMDKYSRRIVGWKFGRSKNLDLTMGAFDQAVAERQPPPGLIFHTDRGTEYGALAFRDRLAELGFIQSMNRLGGKLADNNHMESFFHSMKAEGVHGVTFRDGRAAAGFLRSYMPFYNERRLYSSLDYLAPAEFEATIAQTGVY